MYNDITKYILESQPKTELSYTELSNLALYDILQMPYFNNKYQFVSLYRNINDELLIGNQANDYIHTQIYPTNINSPENFVLENTDAHLLADLIFNETPNQHISLLINNNERNSLEHIINKVENSNSITDLTDLSIEEIALIERFVGKKSISGVLEMHTSYHDDGFAYGIDYMIYGSDKFSPFSLVSLNSVDSYITDLLKWEKDGYKIENYFYTKVEYNDLKVGTLGILLIYDNLMHLLNTVQSLPPTEYSSFFNKFRKKEFENTIIGVLLSEIPLKEKSLKIYDKLAYPKLKNRISKKIKDVLNRENIEDLISENKSFLEKNRENLINIYPSLSEKSPLIFEKYSIAELRLEKNKELYVKTYEDIINSFKNKVNLFADTTSDFKINNLSLTSHKIESLFKKGFTSDYIKEDIIIIRNDLEVLGIVSKNESNYAMADITFPIMDFNHEKIKDDELKEIYQNLINMYKDEYVVMTFDVNNLSHNDDDILEQQKKVLKNILMELKEDNKNEIVMFVLSNDDSYIEKEIILENTSNKNIDYKDYIKLMNNIDSLIKLEDSRYITDSKYFEIIENCVKKSKKELKKSSIRPKI